MADLNADQIALVKRFATARRSAECLAGPPETGFAPRWHPKLAGKLVRLSRGAPWYNTHEDAIAAAGRYRDECRAWLTAREARRAG